MHVIGRFLGMKSTDAPTPSPAPAAAPAAAVPETADAPAGAPPQPRRSFSSSWSDNDVRFLRCVDAVLEADDRLTIVQAEYEDWRVERLVNQTDPSKRTWKLSHRPAKFWMVRAELPSSEDLLDKAKTLLKMQTMGKRRTSAKSDEDVAEEDEEAEAEAEQVRRAEAMEEFKDSTQLASQVIKLEDEDDDDGDSKLFEEEVVLRNQDRQVAAAAGTSPPPPPDYAPFNGSFPWGPDGPAPGTAGFNAHCRQQMERSNVPSRSNVTAPVKGDAPSLQPYQQTASFVAHPSASAAFCRGGPLEGEGVAPGYPRLLVAHCTGSGKTCTMIRIADNFFNDKRPKLLLFPTTAVCQNFYRELMSDKFPNRYANFLLANNLHADMDTMRKALELQSKTLRQSEKLKDLGRGVGLREGQVSQKMLEDENMPSAPLRAFSYTQAGGVKSCGKPHPDNGAPTINAVFKCPDGYVGGWRHDPSGAPINPSALEALRDVEDEDDIEIPRRNGYDEYQRAFDGNPFSNKVHNLVQPSDEIAKNAKRMLMLANLREMLRTAKNCVLVGLTGTPLGKDVSAKDELLKVIKGDVNKNLNDEGFVSYFMDRPPAVFASLHPPYSLPPDALPGVLVPSGLKPPSAIRSFELQNLPAAPGKKKETGHLAMYMESLRKGVQPPAARCSISQSFGHAGAQKTFSILSGSHKSSTLQLEVAAADEDVLMSRALGHGFKLMLRLLETECGKVGVPVCGYDAWRRAPAFRRSATGHRRGLTHLFKPRVSERGAWAHAGYDGLASPKSDEQLLRLLGSGKCSGQKDCVCNLCKFNSPKNLRGEEIRVMVADAKHCSEGVSFFGVRSLLLIDIPPTWTDYVQRVGRAVRFNGHNGQDAKGDGLAKEEKQVEVTLYQAQLPSDPRSSAEQRPSSSADFAQGSRTGDERLSDELPRDMDSFGKLMEALRSDAVDKDMWTSDQSDDGTTSDEQLLQLLKKVREARLDEAPSVRHAVGTLSPSSVVSHDHMMTGACALAQAEQLDAVQEQLPLVRMALKAASSLSPTHDHLRCLMDESEQILKRYEAGRDRLQKEASDASDAAAMRDVAAKQAARQATADEKAREKQAAQQAAQQHKQEQAAAAQAARVDNLHSDGLPNLIKYLSNLAKKPDNAHKAGFDAEAELAGWNALRSVPRAATASTSKPSFTFQNPSSEAFPTLKSVAEHFGFIVPERKRKRANEEAGIGAHDHAAEGL